MPLCAPTQDLFWPAPSSAQGSADEGAAADELSIGWLQLGALPKWAGVPLFYVCLIAGHVLILPFLVLLPKEWEIQWEEVTREAVSKRRLPVGLLWFFPAGRFALWSLSTLTLAWLCTSMRSAGRLGLGGEDGLLLLYMLGWASGEWAELQTSELLGAYLHDTFNVLDLVLIIFMLLTLVTRVAAATVSDGTLLLPVLGITLSFAPDVGASGALLDGAAVAAPTEVGALVNVRDALATSALPIQALTAMLAWLRLLQVCTAHAPPHPTPTRCRRSFPSSVASRPQSTRVARTAARHRADPSRHLASPCPSLPPLPPFARATSMAGRPSDALRTRPRVAHRCCTCTPSRGPS